MPSQLAIWKRDSFLQRYLNIYFKEAITDCSTKIKNLGGFSYIRLVQADHFLSACWATVA
jgi:hypothetical protein